jgi:hypothetical protein
MAWCGARPACVEGADRPGEAAGAWAGWRGGVACSEEDGVEGSAGIERT